MVLGEALDHGVEGDKARSGEHPGLAHGAPETLAPPACLIDGLDTSAEEAAGRATQALRKAERNGVRGRGDVRDVNTERHRGVEDPSSVEVHNQSLGVSRST